jgi:hypothetical protein
MTAQHNPRLQRLFAIFAAAVLLAWPACYNRYPLLFPDSITYIGDGRPIARSLFIHRIAGIRSKLYSLGIFAWHWNKSGEPLSESL